MSINDGRFFTEQTKHIHFGRLSIEQRRCSNTQLSQCIYHHAWRINAVLGHLAVCLSSIIHASSLITHKNRHKIKIVIELSAMNRMTRRFTFNSILQFSSMHRMTSEKDVKSQNISSESPVRSMADIDALRICHRNPLSICRSNCQRTDHKAISV